MKCLNGIKKMDFQNVVCCCFHIFKHSGQLTAAMFYRITDQRHERLPYFVFGDFNFRLDSKQVIEVSDLHDNTNSKW